MALSEAQLRAQRKYMKKRRQEEKIKLEKAIVLFELSESRSRSERELLINKLLELGMNDDQLNALKRNLTNYYRR